MYDFDESQGNMSEKFRINPVNYLIKVTYISSLKV